MTVEEEKMDVGNGRNSSQPSFPAPVEPTEEELEDRLDALYGVVSRTAAGIEHLNHSFDRLEGSSEQMRKDIRIMKHSLHVIEERTAQIPAIKQLLTEFITSRGRE